MKNLKMALAAFVVVAAAALAFTVPSKKLATTLDYTYVGTTFSMGTSDNSPIVTTDNWQVTSGNPSCLSTNNLCRVIASFDGTPSPAIQESDILTAVKNQYVTNGNTFGDNDQFTVSINGVNVQITTELKSGL